jgi:hypothetical protein
MKTARQVAAGVRSTGVTLNRNGSLTVDLHDISDTAERMFGEREYERLCTVPKKHAARLAAALLYERFWGDLKAVDNFKAFCDAYGIPADIQSW